MHEQELFRLAAKSDASADLEQVSCLFPRKPVNISSCLFLWGGGHTSCRENVVDFVSAPEGPETEAP